jgi:hypothetical protein
MNARCEGKTLEERIAVLSAESDRVDGLLHFAPKGIVLIDGSRVFLKGCK